MGLARSQTRAQSVDLRLYAKIVKEGTLLKQSKYLRQWRERTVILTHHKLVTFPIKPSESRENLTSTLELRIVDIQGLQKYQTNDIHYLEVTADSEPYTFKMGSEEECQEWYNAIKRLKTNLTRVRRHSYP